MCSIQHMSWQLHYYGDRPEGDETRSLSLSSCISTSLSSPPQRPDGCLVKLSLRCREIISQRSLIQPTPLWFSHGMSCSEPEDLTAGNMRIYLTRQSRLTLSHLGNRHKRFPAACQITEQPVLMAARGGRATGTAGGEQAVEASCACNEGLSPEQQ